MFDDSDYEKMDKMQVEFPDGLFDASEFHFVLEKITEIISRTDFVNDQSRMEMMMDIVNECYEEKDGEMIISEKNLFGVVIGLCFNYSNVMSNLINEGFDAESYFNFLMNEVIAEMREESKNLPYWEI